MSRRTELVAVLQGEANYYRHLARRLPKGHPVARAHLAHVAAIEGALAEIQDHDAPCAEVELERQRRVSDMVLEAIRAELRGEGKRLRQQDVKDLIRTTRAEALKGALRRHG